MLALLQNAEPRHCCCVRPVILTCRSFLFLHPVKCLSCCLSAIENKAQSSGHQPAGVVENPSLLVRTAALACCYLSAMVLRDRRTKHNQGIQPVVVEGSNNVCCRVDMHGAVDQRNNESSRPTADVRQQQGMILFGLQIEKTTGC